MSWAVILVNLVMAVITGGVGGLVAGLIVKSGSKPAQSPQGYQQPMPQYPPQQGYYQQPPPQPGQQPPPQQPSPPQGYPQQPYPPQ